MVLYIKYIENLINEFKKLPGVGPKSAKRIVYFLLKRSPKEIEIFSENLLEMSKKVRFCKICYNLSESDICSICSDPQRDNTKICVVQEISDIAVIESTGQYRGLYHVLGNLLSPIDNIGPAEVHIPQLIARLRENNIEEIILALNPTVEGESTASYLKNIIKPLGIAVTRLASGLPVGGNIEYADEVTMARALADRKEYE